MKRTNNYFLLLILLSGLIIPSCKKDNGTPEGLTRASLTGKWMVTETQKKITYEVTILIDSTTSGGVLINNFAGAGPTVNAFANLSGSSLALTNNELLSNGWVVNGSGAVSGTSRIDWPYTIHDGANLISIQAVFTKK
jgi:hypothetical protein